MSKEGMPVLWIIIPCYNEEKVLPVTAPLFLEKLQNLMNRGRIDRQSRILFIDDGSGDRTWELIRNYSEKNSSYAGISLSRNRGHQNALLAGLLSAINHCDITISMDCDGQDDIHAIDEMIQEYQKGAEIVYGVRSDRSTDTRFKRMSAQLYYKLLNYMGVETIYNHADFRLVSAKVLKQFNNYQEVNLYLRGLFPLVGYKKSVVYYKRNSRLAGQTHYPLKKMIALGVEGITSLSIKPLRMLFGAGFCLFTISLLLLVITIVSGMRTGTIDQLKSILFTICCMGGFQLISIGILGEYIGKTYLETKHRPRFIVAEKTGFHEKEKNERGSEYEWSFPEEE
ncbi:MAG: glycosyltransferase [Eubacteriales bacterium]|nr:glycosyltransferase [Eubacteriales bacterium]